MALSVIGIAILAGGGFWIFGGIALRVIGVFFVIAGVANLLFLHDPFALFVVVLGFALWLAGHWHFAFRHHEYKSPLARRIFLQILPPRWDPTRNWGTADASEIARDRQEDVSAGLSEHPLPSSSPDQN